MCVCLCLCAHKNGMNTKHDKPARMKAIYRLQLLYALPLNADIETGFVFWWLSCFSTIRLSHSLYVLFVASFFWACNNCFRIWLGEWGEKERERESDSFWVHQFSWSILVSTRMPNDTRLGRFYCLYKCKCPLFDEQFRWKYQMMHTHTYMCNGTIEHLLWQLYHSIYSLSVGLQWMQMVWAENWHIRWLNATERHQMNSIYRYWTMYEQQHQLACTTRTDAEKQRRSA